MYWLWNLAQPPKPEQWIFCFQIVVLNASKFGSSLNSTVLNASKFGCSVQNSVKYLVWRSMKTRGLNDQRWLFQQPASMINAILAWSCEHWILKSWVRIFPAVAKMDTNNCFFILVVNHTPNCCHFLPRFVRTRRQDWRTRTNSELALSSIVRVCQVPCELCPTEHAVFCWLPLEHVRCALHRLKCMACLSNARYTRRDEWGSFSS